MSRRVYERLSKIEKVPPKERTCLKCDKAFLSVNGDRLCEGCNRLNKNQTDRIIVRTDRKRNGKYF